MSKKSNQKQIVEGAVTFIVAFFSFILVISVTRLIQFGELAFLNFNNVFLTAFAIAGLAGAIDFFYNVPAVVRNFNTSIIIGASTMLIVFLYNQFNLLTFSIGWIPIITLNLFLASFQVGLLVGLVILLIRIPVRMLIRI